MGGLLQGRSALAGGASAGTNLAGAGGLGGDGAHVRRLEQDAAVKVRAISLTTIAVGCIVAEGLGGIAKPALAKLGLMPPL